MLVKDGRIIKKLFTVSTMKVFYLNQRNSRDYEAIRVDLNDVYLIERYYRQNKSIPLLRQMIVQIKVVKSELYENYCLY